MNSIIKKIFITGSIVLLIPVIIFAIAFMIGVKEAHKNYGEKNVNDLYFQQRSEEEIKQRKDDLNMLATTGKCIGCNLMSRQGDENNEDLYQSIKSAKNKGLIIDLSGTNLWFAQLDGIDLSKADLSNTTLIGASLDKANLSNTNLTKADLTGAKLNNANLENANLTEAILDRTKVSEANFSNANLHKAKLIRIFLTNANLTNANVTNAWIWDVSGSEAKLIGADLRGAKILNSLKKDTDFTNTKFDGLFMRLLNSFSLWLITTWTDMKSHGYYWKQGNLAKKSMSQE